MKNSPAFLVSIPFTSGVAIGVALASCSAGIWPRQLSLLVFLVCLFLLLKGRKSDMLLTALMFLSLGVFCFLLRDNDLHMQIKSNTAENLITPDRKSVV